MVKMHNDLAHSPKMEPHFAQSVEFRVVEGAQ
jgi:hypothetical protein